jgi:hypothetical protein
MIHQRKGLAFGFESGDDAFGVHAELDDFECHAAADGFVLFGHVNHAAAALAELLKELVAADARAGFFGELGGGDEGFLLAHRRGLFKEFAGFVICVQEAIDLATEIGVVAAGLKDVSMAMLRL